MRNSEWTLIASALFWHLLEFLAWLQLDIYSFSICKLDLEAFILDLKVKRTCLATAWLKVVHPCRTPQRIAAVQSVIYILFLFLFSNFYEYIQFNHNLIVPAKTMVPAPLIVVMPSSRRTSNSVRN